MFLCCWRKEDKIFAKLVHVMIFKLGELFCELHFSYQHLNFGLRISNSNILSSGNLT